MGATTISPGDANLTLTNYSAAGPITSGPHEEPFICVTGTFPIYGGTDRTLPDKTVYGATPDKDCMAATKITYLYLPKGTDMLKPLADPAKPPADVASTTTSSGVTMKFIVRLETS